jgi:hypothetical protein
MSTPKNVFIAHTAGHEVFPGGNAARQMLAAEMHLRREMLAEIADRRGKPRFEVFRFHVQ